MKKSEVLTSVKTKNFVVAVLKGSTDPGGVFFPALAAKMLMNINTFSISPVHMVLNFLLL